MERLVDKLLLKVRTWGFWLRLRNLGGGNPLFLRTSVGEPRGGQGEALFYLSQVFQVTFGGELGAPAAAA